MKYKQFSLLVSALSLSVVAEAGGTRTLAVGTDKFKEGDFDGASLDASGTLRAGWATRSVAVNGPQGAFCSHRSKDGSLLIGSSPDGKIYRVQGKDVSLYAETGELAVTAFAEDDKGHVYASTLPGGKVFRLDGKKAEVVATLKDTPNLFALIWSKGALYAAGGTMAKVYRVTPGGAATVAATLEDQSVVSLAAGPNGEIYAGTSNKGRLYKLDGNGGARVMHDFGEHELKSLVVQADGSVFVAANDYGGGGVSDSGTDAPVIKKSSVGKSRPGKGALYRLWPNGRVEKLMAHSETTYMTLVPQGDGRFCVGAGADGRVYCANTDHAVTMVADTPERQVVGLNFQDGKGAFVTSDPVVVHELQGKGDEPPTWASRVLDAGGIARFGRLTREASGVIFETRSGNTDLPDTSWSAWEKSGSDGVIKSPPGRYLQLRVKWDQLSGTARDLRVYYSLPNGRAVVTLVTASVKAPESKSDTPPRHETSVKLSWKTDNDDNDPVRYRPSFKREGLSTWIPVLRGDEWTSKTELEWDTALVPEGRYRARVEVSDAASNAPGSALKHEATSETFVIDNTAPVITSLAVAGSRVSFTAADTTSLLLRADVLVDGRAESAMPLEPLDGLWDALEEKLSADVAELLTSPGEHSVTVRVWDAAGNVSVRDALIRK